MNDSTDKPKRTKEQIDQDYTRCAMQIGDLEFKKRRIDAEINRLYGEMVNYEIQATAALEEKKKLEVVKDAAIVEEAMATLQDEK